MTEMRPRRPRTANARREALYTGYRGALHFLLAMQPKAATLTTYRGA